MDKILTQVHNSLLPLASSIGNIVYGIAGIAALYYIGDKVWRNLANKEAIDFYPLLRPFVIGVLILNFDVLVVTPMHYVLSPVRTVTNKVVIDMKMQNKALIAEQKLKAQMEKEAAAKKKKEEYEKKDWLSKLKENAVDAAETVWEHQPMVMLVNFIRENILDAFIWLFSSIRDFMIFLYKILRIFFMSILNLVGPIAFALSIFPGFGSAINNWLSKYISIYLWLPICNVLNILLTKLETLMIKNVHLTDDIGEGGFKTMVIFIYLIGIVAYAAVPTISTWIVPNGENGQALSGLRALGKGVGSMVGAGAGALVGSGIGRAFKSKDKGK